MSSFKEEDIGLSSELDSSEKQAELDKSFKKEERKSSLRGIILELAMVPFVNKQT